MLERMNQEIACFMPHLYHYYQYHVNQVKQEYVKQQEMSSAPFYVKLQQSSVNQLCVKEQQFDSSKNATGVAPLLNTGKSILAKMKHDKHRKNSNVIKKYGRIILKYQKIFNLSNSKNEGFEVMMRELSTKLLRKNNSKDLSDNFSTKHLLMLFQNTSPDVTTFNLKTVSRLLAQKMRKEILGSKQIRDGNNLVYLNTMKCSQMRLCNKALALRLEIPSQME